MRLIDAEVFEELFNKQIEYGATDIFDAVEDALQDTSSIDAVPVVRCKDCTWFNYGYCMSFDDDVMPDGFCSRGHTET